MSLWWRRILISAGFAVGVAIVALLAIIAYALLSDEGGGPPPQVAQPTETATPRPSPTATPRATPTAALPTVTPEATLQATPQPTEEPPPAPVVQEQPPPTQEEPPPPTPEPPAPTEEPPPAPTQQAPANASASGTFPSMFEIGNAGQVPASQTQVSVNVVSLTFSPTGGPVNGEAHYLASGAVCPDRDGKIQLDVVLQGSFDAGTSELHGTAQWDFTNSRPVQDPSTGACQVQEDHWSIVGVFDGDLKNGQIRMGVGMPTRDAQPSPYYGPSYVMVNLTLQGS